MGNWIGRLFGVDEKKLRGEINQCTAGVAWIETVSTMVNKMGTDFKVEEATLNLGGIVVSLKKSKCP